MMAKNRSILSTSINVLLSKHSIAISHEQFNMTFSSLMKYNQINQSAEAKRKLTNIAKHNSLPLSFVDPLFQLFWNYDLAEPCWVTDTLTQDKKYQDHIEQLFQQIINLQPDSLLNDYQLLSIDDYAQAILDTNRRFEETTLLQTFQQSALQKNLINISEFSSYHYIRNANLENLVELPLYPKIKQLNQLEKRDWLFFVFIKIFRAGCVDRFNIAYLYIDLCIKLPNVNNTKHQNELDWLSKFLLDLEKSDSKLKLSDLRKFLRKYVKGNHHYLQIILEALANARLLKVGEYNSSHLFLPKYRNILSKHFYSNDWAYPLRMWNDQSSI